MQEGTVVGKRFVIGKLAGRGGMGVVYAAEDLQTGERAAVKVLHDSSAATIGRFEREAQVLAGLDHPNIVRHLGHGLLPSGEPYLAMEWLEGYDLLRWLARGSLGVEEVLGIVERVADALGVAHARGIVHRDIKPANVMLLGGDPRRVKLLDFGIARVASELIELTGTGFALGTPGYMSPEQARSSRRIDARADVYSLGCVLFRCLAGRTPFVGRDPVAILAKIALEQPPRVRELRPEISPAIDDLVARMLSHRAADRFVDGSAVAAAIRGVTRTSTPGARLSVPVALTSDEKRLVGVVLAPGAARAGQWLREASEASRADASALYDERDATSLDATSIVATGQSEVPGRDCDATAGEEHDRRVAARIRQSAIAHGARAVFLADGSAAALLSSTGSAVDLAVRAARCALAFARVIEGSPIAVSTGRAEISGRFPVGDAIDRAVTLIQRRRAAERQTLAPGERTVWIDAVTAGLIADRFEITGTGDDARLEGEIVDPVATRTVLGRVTPFVGRDRELLTLEAVYSECVSESVARVVLVTGPAGEGKSRLRHEFVRARARTGAAPMVLVARGDPLGAGSAFSLLGQALARVLAPDPRQPIDARREAVRERVAMTVAAEDVERVVAFVGEIVGVPLDDAENVQLYAARQDSMVMGDQIRRACEDLLAAESAVRPVVLVLEDLQWGDRPTVQFVDAMLRNLADLPVMVLALGRAEVHVAFPGLFASHAATAILLGPLSRKAAERLARAILGADAAASTVERIVIHAAGNAFYLEELLRAVAEGRAEAELPETVLAIVQARIEALESDARRVLRAASVLGPVFWRDAVVSLLGAGSDELVDDWLAELARREWLSRRVSSRFVATREYVFRHASVREAAYATLTEADRVLGHRLAGEWLERAGERDALILAGHFRLGHERERALHRVVDAVRQALEGNDLESVLRWGDAAVEMGASGGLLGEVRLFQAEAHRWRGDNAMAGERSREALGLLSEGTAGWFRAVGEIATAAGRMADVDALEIVAARWSRAKSDVTSDGARRVAGARLAVQLFHAARHDTGNAVTQAIELGIEALRDTEPLAVAWVDIGRMRRALCAGEVAGALRYARSAVAQCERAGDLRTAAMQRVNIGYACIEVGALAEAEETLRTAVANAERLGLRDVEAIARSNLGLALTLREDLAAARTELCIAIAFFVVQRNLVMEGASRIYLSMALFAEGELDAADAEIRRGIDVLDRWPGARAYALATRARIVLALGNTAEALALAREAYDQVDPSGEGEATVRIVYGEVQRAAGDRDGARATVLAACTRVRERAALIEDDSLRELFLRGVPDHARTLDFGQD
ncbi:MAG: protein kinase [Deltaproteobacteria bacterium]